MSLSPLTQRPFLASVKPFLNSFRTQGPHGHASLAFLVFIISFISGIGKPSGLHEKSMQMQGEELLLL
jgi:hypothetical protein